MSPVYSHDACRWLVPSLDPVSMSIDCSFAAPMVKFANQNPYMSQRSRVNYMHFLSSYLIVCLHDFAAGAHTKASPRHSRQCVLRPFLMVDLDRKRFAAGCKSDGKRPNKGKDE